MNTNKLTQLAVEKEWIVMDKSLNDESFFIATISVSYQSAFSYTKLHLSVLIDRSRGLEVSRDGRGPQSWVLHGRCEMWDRLLTLTLTPDTSCNLQSTSVDRSLAGSPDIMWRKVRKSLRTFLSSHQQTIIFTASQSGPFVTLKFSILGISNSKTFFKNMLRGD